MFVHLDAFRNRSVAVAATFCTLALLVAAPPAPAGAAANAAEPLPQRVVPAADLDLTTSDGVATLYRRLATAAAIVCPAADRELLRTQIARNCRLQVLDEAVGRVALPSLTALHRERGGRVSARYATR